MRNSFAFEIGKIIHSDPKVILLLGDVGYGIFDDLRKKCPDQVINVGSAEQLLIGAAVGLALEGRVPICYSITPFLVLRPFEFIRNYLNIEKLPVKLVGSGRDYDYSEAGYTHHAHDVPRYLDQFENIRKFYPQSNLQLLEVLETFVYGEQPAFLSLKR